MNSSDPILLWEPDCTRSADEPIPPMSGKAAIAAAVNVHRMEASAATGRYAPAGDSRGAAAAPKIADRPGINRIIVLFADCD